MLLVRKVETKWAHTLKEQPDWALYIRPDAAALWLSVVSSAIFLCTVFKKKKLCTQISKKKKVYKCKTTKKFLGRGSNCIL